MQPDRTEVEEEAGKGGWEKHLLPVGVGCMDAIEHGSALPDFNPALAWSEKGVSTGSKNHEALSWGFELLRAALARLRDPSDPVEQQRWLAASAVVLNAYLPRELCAPGDHRAIGLWGDEPFCSGAHGGFHLAGCAAVRLAATLIDKAKVRVPGDSDLLKGSESLLTRNTAALLCVATPALDVWSAGAAAAGLPRNPVATDWLRQVKGKEHRGALAKAAGWADQMYLAARILRHLQSVSDPATLALAQIEAAPCPLKRGLSVYRWDNSYLSILDSKGGRIRGPVCDWLLVTNGGAVEYSINGQNPIPPRVPATARHLRFPAVGGDKNA